MELELDDGEEIEIEEMCVLELLHVLAVVLLHRMGM